MHENDGFPCGINGFRVFVTDAARRTPSGQGEGQTAKKGTKWPGYPTAKKGIECPGWCRTATRALKVAKGGLSGLECARKADKRLHLISTIHIFGHLMLF